MKNNFTIGVVLLTMFITTGITAQEKQKNTGSGALKVFVNGFSSDKGSAMISLCNSQECYKKIEKPFMGVMAAIKDGKAEWVINDLPFGTYTISVFHDENGNGKLDTGLFGVPKEKYGFSNNARGTFGPPKFEEVQFVFDTAEMTVHITIKQGQCREDIGSVSHCPDGAIVCAFRIEKNRNDKLMPFGFGGTRASPWTAARALIARKPDRACASTSCVHRLPCRSWSGARAGDPVLDRAKPAR